MKTVVCVMGQIRYPDLTWSHFKKYVTDELGADIVTCGPDSLKLNEFTRNSILNIHSDPDTEPTAQKILDHRRNLFREIPNVYDQYILTRSDHMWYGPHPKLDPSYAWFMNSEFHYGISDRHWVLNKFDFEKYCREPGNFDSKFNNIESYLFSKVNWGPTTALSPFPMYLTGERAEYRRPDEIHASREILHWPFKFIHNELSRNGMYTGRAIKTYDS